MSADRLIVDTAALAAHLGRRPSYVRWLARKGIIHTIGRKVLGQRGRPTMWFDIDAVDEALVTWRAKLDQGCHQVRK